LSALVRGLVRSLLVASVTTMAPQNTMPNPDGAQCETLKVDTAKNWYFWVERPRSDLFSSMNERHWYAAGGTSRAYRAYVAQLKAREQAKEVVVVA
jgi:hypothetical protein